MSQPTTYVFVSAVAGSMAMLFKKLNIDMEQVTLDELAGMIKQDDVIINFVRHPKTLELIKQKIQKPIVDGGKEYKLDPSHKIVMFGLAQRQEKSGEEVNVTSEEQLVIFIVTVNSATPLSR